jgi:hypothetical protein
MRIIAIKKEKTLAGKSHENTIVANSGSLAEKGGHFWPLVES